MSGVYGQYSELINLLDVKGTKYLPVIVDAMTRITDSQLTLLKRIGEHDASGGSIPSDSPNTGDYWVITVAGTILTVDYYENDWIVWNGTGWERTNNQGAAGSAPVSDDPYDASWNGNTDAASKNALYNAIESIDIQVKDDAYGVGWNGDTVHTMSKNALFDSIATHIATGDYHHTPYISTDARAAVLSDVAYGVSWNGVNDVAPTQNAMYDKFIELESYDWALEDAVYSSAWNGDTDGATKNALYDEMNKYHEDFDVPIGTYVGTYTFTSDSDDSQPAGFTINNDPASGTARVVSDYLGHSKVFKMTNTVVGTTVYAWQIFSGQDYGSIEFWWAVDDASLANEFYLQNSSYSDLARLFINLDTFRYGSAAGTIITNAQDKKWYYIAIDFEDTAGGYDPRGDGALAINTWRVYIDGVQYGDYAFMTTGNVAAIMICQSTAQTGAIGYYDAISYSWDGSYSLGDNLEQSAYGKQIYCDVIDVPTDNILYFNQDTIVLKNGATVSDLQDAIDDLTNGGTIYLPADTMTVSTTVDIDTGKSYVIKGVGAETVLAPDGNRDVFNITSASSVRIENMAFDLSGYSSEAYYAIKINGVDNPVVVNSCIFYGDSTNGRVIYINSDYTTIEYCHAYSLGNIYIYITGCNYVDIHHNYLANCEDYTVQLNNCNYCKVNYNIINDADFGILFFSDVDYSEISGNSIYSADYYAIYLDNSEHNIIEANTIYQAQQSGIFLSDSHFNAISGNVVYDTTFSGGGTIAAIMLYDNSDYNALCGNLCQSWNNAGAGNGYGILIQDASSANNIVHGNHLRGNDINLLNNGTNTTVASNNTA